MEISKAYKDLLEQMKVSGSKDFDGYNAETLNQVYEWERAEVETIIWKAFHVDKDMEMAILLPKLKAYDGIRALKEVLESCKVPSYNSVRLSQILYEYTGEERYVDLIKRNIDMSNDAVSYVVMLSRCRPCDKIYKFMIDIYLNSDNEVIRNTAVLGILYNKGLISNPDNIQEVMQKVELMRKFISNNLNERREIIDKFEKGEILF